MLASRAVPETWPIAADRAVLKDMTSRLIGRFVLAVERATGRHTVRATSCGTPRTSSCRWRLEPSARSSKAVAAHFVMYADERLALQEREREVIADLVGMIGGGTAYPS